MPAIPEMMIAEAEGLMMRRLWMQLWILRHARRGSVLLRPANGRPRGGREDGGGDLDVAEVCGAVEMN